MWYAMSACSRALFAHIQSRYYPEWRPSVDSQARPVELDLLEIHFLSILHHLLLVFCPGVYLPFLAIILGILGECLSEPNIDSGKEV